MNLITFPAICRPINQPLHGKFSIILMILSVTLSAQTEEIMDTLPMPTQIEITIVQEQNGERIEIDTIIPFKELPNLEELFNNIIKEKLSTNIPKAVMPFPDNRFHATPHLNSRGAISRPTKKNPSLDTATPACKPLPNKGYLGIYIDEYYDSLGVKINKIIPNSAACKAGLQSGDLILAINDITTNNFDALRYVIDGLRANDTVMIDYERNGESRNIEAILLSNVSMQIANTRNLPLFPLPPSYENKPTIDWENTIQSIISAKKCENPPTAHCGAVIHARIDTPEANEYAQLSQAGVRHKARQLPIQDLQASFDPESLYLSLGFRVLSTQNTTVRLLDLKGRQLFAETLPEFGGDYRRTTRLTTAHQSICYLVISQGKAQCVKRVSLK